MNFYKLRKLSRSNSTSPAKLALIISLVLIVLAWPFPMFFNNLQMQFFGIPFMYFYIIIISPALILFVTNWAVNLAEKLDRNQLETEND